jgi:hypothetical protein
MQHLPIQRRVKKREEKTFKFEVLNWKRGRKSQWKNGLLKIA